MDITAWLLWFLAALHRAIQHAHTTLDAVLAKAHFWQRFASTPFNPRQIKLLNGSEVELSSDEFFQEWLSTQAVDTPLKDQAIKLRTQTLKALTK
jgi:Fic family protein